MIVVDDASTVNQQRGIVTSELWAGFRFTGSAAGPPSSVLVLAVLEGQGELPRGSDLQPPE